MKILVDKMPINKLDCQYHYECGNKNNIACRYNVSDDCMNFLLPVCDLCHNECFWFKEFNLDEYLAERK